MSHTIEPVNYASEPNGAFQDALKARVDAHLATRRAGRKATPFMWGKVVFYVAAYWLVWTQLALVAHPLWLTALLIAAFSMLCVGLAYNVSHDAVHGALSSRGWLNEALFYFTFNPLGPSAYLWRLRHTVMHHSCVNIPGLDYNIEASDILRFSPTQQWRPIHRYQHLYAPLAYLVFTLHWVFVKDFQLLRTTQIGNVTNIRHPWWRWAEVLTWKAVYAGYMIVLPMVVLPYAWWHILLAYLVFQFIVSFQFVLTFTGSHLNEGMVFVEHGADNAIPHSFYEHALHTSLDFDPTHPVVSFWLGGFNGHVAHHMFPGTCSVHYPQLTPIISDTAAEYGLPYKQISTAKLFVRHFRYLRQLGRDDASPSEAYLYRKAA